MSAMIISEGIPVGFFPTMQEAQDAMQYVKRGFVKEVEDGI